MDRGIVLVPGARQGPWAPLLNYAWLAAEFSRHAKSLPIEWPAEQPDLTRAEEVGAWVRGQISPKLDAFPVARPVLVGKSLGAYAVGVAADRGLPAIWLTPHLVQPWVVAQLRRATAPFLLIGGTADKVWLGDVARDLTPHVLEVPGANHGMVIPGEPLARTAQVLGQVATAYEEFLDTVVWPAR